MECGSLLDGPNEKNRGSLEPHSEILDGNLLNEEVGYGLDLHLQTSSNNVFHILQEVG